MTFLEGQLFLSVRAVWLDKSRWPFKKPLLFWTWKHSGIAMSFIQNRCVCGRGVFLFPSRP